MAEPTAGALRRCAVYTRKSSEEGLEQEFNSLHAQREACEAYVLSQKHEGWRLLATPYDDGGISGGTMDRTGLQTLLADVRGGLVDIVVVYKVDRLTRSLADFAKIVEIFDAHGVSFVSVTQAFSTTSSMGRLTLNVLLSFAQFEREVTGERIRDKIAASKAKGMWMGGTAPLGYDPKERKLVINEPEAVSVRRLFSLYQSLGSADAVVEAAYAEGIRSKPRAKGPTPAGMRIQRGALYTLLANPLYVGEIPHRDKRYPGQHEPIVDRKLFEAVQAMMNKNRRRRGKGGRSPALLAGLVFEASGRRLTSTHTAKGKQRYRYYADIAPDRTPGALRLGAQDLEQIVMSGLCSKLASSEAVVGELLGGQQLDGLDLPAIIEQAKQLGAKLGKTSGAPLRDLLQDMISKVSVADTGVTIMLRLSAFGLATDGEVALCLPTSLARHRGSLMLVVPGPIVPTAPDPALISCVAQARVWFDALASGKATSIRGLAEDVGVSPSYVGKVINLAFLAPDTVTMIAEGRQPRSLTPTRLFAMCPLPPLWADQAALFAAI